LALLLWLHPLVGVEAAVAAIAARHLAGNLGGNIRDVEFLDAFDPALAGQQPFPGLFNSAGERRHQSKACDHHAPHRGYSWPTQPECRPAACGDMRSRQSTSFMQKCQLTSSQLFAFFSRNLMASPTVKIVSAASSGISQPNSSSKAMTSSTVSRLSAPRSSMKLALSTTFSGSTPRCSTTIFLTRSPISLIVQPRVVSLTRPRG